MFLKLHGKEKIERTFLNFMIVSNFVCGCVIALSNDKFLEELEIQPLPSGHVYTYMQFTTVWDVDKRPGSCLLAQIPGKLSSLYLCTYGLPLQRSLGHIRAFSCSTLQVFPLSLGEILGHHSVQELPYISAPPGAELWTWFKEETPDISKAWSDLTNALSGQFCASLNFIDPTNTISPRFSFLPQGVASQSYAKNYSLLRYSALPREAVCTENLTPWKKLLPCNSKAGLSMLLNAIQVFSATYVSLAVDVRPICRDNDCKEASLELRLSISIVFEPPVSHKGKQDWSLVKLFGSGILKACPLATRSTILVHTTSNQTLGKFLLSPEPSQVVTSSHAQDKKTYAMYDVKKILQSAEQLNIVASYQKSHVYWITSPPILSATRFITGYGMEQGGIKTQLYNNHPSKSMKIVYLEIIPWFLRVYLHTLQLKTSGKALKPQVVHFQPGRDRTHPYHFEIIATLPPASVTELSFQFDRAFLKWTEYPPDANHGFYISSAVISTLLNSAKNCSRIPLHKSTILESLIDRSVTYFIRLHTEMLLVSLPTPDFSMPYNVICLACTVVALAFGPIHNITTKRLQLVEKDKNQGLFTKIKKLFWRKSYVESDKEETKKNK
ncbi:GPI transamidase component PIG-T-like [Limulus polyphemus]|uniref:GPI transamidase component PIG-T-like n=1 Tax=Limulus polyphemus TaxID=6850 RepID=A0ABM1B983_LIMPO|nr:GPI transamidase component PIG-T-like [Limulus polyphemus]